MDALGLEQAALIGHSSSGDPASSIALEHPDRVIALSWCSAPAACCRRSKAGGTKVGGREAAAQARLEDRMVRKEPTLADTRALLEANLFHHDLITDEELRCVTKTASACFEEFVRRHEAGEQGNKGGKEEGKPLWQQLVELKMPLLLIYGRNDRARAEERAKLLKERYPAAQSAFR